MTPLPSRTLGPMSAVVLAAKVWHYWISVALVGAIALVIVALGIGYLIKVTSQKYPRQ